MVETYIFWMFSQTAMITMAYGEEHDCHVMSCIMLYPDTSRTLGWSRKILCWKPIGLGFSNVTCHFCGSGSENGGCPEMCHGALVAGLCKFILSCHSTCFFFFIGLQYNSNVWRYHTISIAIGINYDDWRELLYLRLYGLVVYLKTLEKKLWYPPSIDMCLYTYIEYYNELYRYMYNTYNTHII